ncbi:inositol monophosphatase family protein [Actinosynnema sp. CA-248983]
MNDIAKLRSITEYVAVTGAEAIRDDLARRATAEPAWPPHPAADRAQGVARNAVSTALHRYWGAAALIGTRLRRHLRDLDWIVDGIDGTANLAAGLPAFTVSVAAVHDGTTIAGAVAEPATGRLWSAGRGLGAQLHDRRLGRSRLPLRAGSQTDLSHALVATALSHHPHHRRHQARALARLVTHVGDLRILGAPALTLCWTAAGALDACYHPRPHDWTAATLIAREADVVVERTDPPDGHLPPGGFYAASPGIAGQLRQALITAGAIAPHHTTTAVSDRPSRRQGEDHAQP